jgi:hypothetical protein
VSAPDETVAHHIGLAIWDLASPVVTGRRATFKVGVSCSCGCDLSGTGIDVQDTTQTKIATAVLGPEPWSGTRALYWTELDVPAPDTEGEHAWSVRATPPNTPPTDATPTDATSPDATPRAGSRAYVVSGFSRTKEDVVSGFSRTDSRGINITHEPVRSTVRVVVVLAPEHRVTCAVTDKGSGAPVAGVELRLGPFRGTTDERGVAYVDVGRGTYSVVAWKIGFDMLFRTVHVTADTRLSLEIVATPQPEQPYWM